MTTLEEQVFAVLDTKKLKYDKDDVRAKLSLLITEFAVDEAEAKRTIIDQVLRENGSTDRYTSGGGAAATVTEIAQFVPGTWVTFVANVVSVAPGAHKAIAQSGVLQDASGMVKFIIWSKAGISLVAGKTYQIENAVVDEYRGAISLKIHSGSSVRETDPLSIPDMILPVNQVTVGVTSVEVQCTRIFDSTSDRILQAGVLGDETGSIKFTIWNNEGETVKPLELLKAYRIIGAPVDSWNDRLNLTLNGCEVVPIKKKIEANDSTDSLTGVIVNVQAGSGLIRRCPVDGCNRTLNRMLICPIHMRQTEFTYDLRIKAVVDTGDEATTAIFNRSLTETLSGVTMDEMIELAKNHPLGFDQTYYDLRDALTGRYVALDGAKLSDAFLVSGCEFVTIDEETSVFARDALVNRATELLAALGGDAE